MLLSLFTFLVFTFAFLRQKKKFGKRAWTITIALACLFSFLLAYISVSAVWTPHPLSDDVGREQNALGEYEGVFPWSELSYPLYLTVYHSPFNQQTFLYPYAYGEARFNIFLANANIIRLNGTFSYYAYVMGPMPLYYKIDFLFSDSLEFFDFLLVLFSFFNIIGTLIGIMLAKTLQKKSGKLGPIKAFDLF